MLRLKANNHKGAKVVNEHGSLNFNTLTTRDPEAAKAFYAGVFGGKTVNLPAGVMWTLFVRPQADTAAPTLPIADLDDVPFQKTACGCK